MAKDKFFDSVPDEMFDTQPDELIGEVLSLTTQQRVITRDDEEVIQDVIVLAIKDLTGRMSWDIEHSFKADSSSRSKWTRWLREAEKNLGYKFKSADDIVGKCFLFHVQDWEWGGSGFVSRNVPVPFEEFASKDDALARVIEVIGEDAYEELVALAAEKTKSPLTDDEAALLRVLGDESLDYDGIINAAIAQGETTLLANLAKSRDVVNGLVEKGILEEEGGVYTAVSPL